MIRLKYSVGGSSAHTLDHWKDEQLRVKYVSRNMLVLSAPKTQLSPSNLRDGAT